MNVRTNPLGEVGDELLGELRHLVRLELEIARTELRQQLKAAVGAAIALAVAAVMSVLGGLLLVLAAADGVAYALGWPAWAGLLTVAIALGIVAAIAWSVGLGRLSRVQVLPKQAAESLSETLVWLKGLPERVLGH